MNRCLHGPQVKNHIGVWYGDDGFPELSCIYIHIEFDLRLGPLFLCLEVRLDHD